ncbi:TraR/DksA family transcriptional regulator [Piscinibacter sp.]|jgi:DnaK suppressor protein|uniref:TraR/DksA family transcriptional regulator n=1 Tax=Piscinibacter sp. TaxID=1903157 RepID=UPI00355A3FB1
MDALTDTQRHTLRDLLAQRRLALEEEIAAPRARPREAERSHEVGDRKDEAADDAMAATDDAEAQRDVDELEQIVAAQQRLADGNYGLCEDCDEPIDIRRLLVMPAASRCAACQAVHEHRPRQASRG